MIECGNGPYFALEALTEIKIRCDVRRKHLDSDSTIEAPVARFVDFTHAARAEGGLDFIRAEPPPLVSAISYFLGMRAFSSSNQFCTRRSSLGRTASWLLWTITNRWPFGETS